MGKIFQYRPRSSLLITNFCFKMVLFREKMAKAMIQRKKQKEQKEASKLKRTTRRRTNFDFDLWSANVTAEGEIKEPENENGMSKNQWLEKQTIDHNLNNSGQMKRKTPSDYYLKESILPAVDTPHGGSSYNPRYFLNYIIATQLYLFLWYSSVVIPLITLYINYSYKEHQDLLWKAAMVELNKEKKQHKIDFHTTNKFPTAKDAPTEETWVNEMSEGMNQLAPNTDVDNDTDSKTPETEDEETKGNKLKTRKQRRKELKLKMKEKRKNYEKREKARVQNVYKIKTLNKEIKAEEEKIAQNMAKRKDKKELKKSLPASITGHKYEEQDLDLKVSSLY